MKNELHPEDLERFEKLYQQIIEIAMGNWNFQQEQSPYRDEIDAVSVLLNMMTEEIKHIFSEGGKVQRPKLEIHVMVLNDKLRIKSHTLHLAQALEMEELVSSHLPDLLTPGYTAFLEEQLNAINTGKEQQQFRLHFKKGSGGSISYPCALKKMITSNKEEIFLLNFYEQEDLYREEEEQDLVREDPLSDNYSQRGNRASTLLLMRKVRLYILKNLDRPLPSLKEIGLIHQTNKTNLKVQFKKLYGTTIYQFYNQKRLEKAGLLIRNTELPISAVIQQCGFKDPSHFARKFKAQFGHSPRIYRGVASS